MWKLGRILFCVFILFALQAGLTNAATLLVTDNASIQIEISNDIDWFPIVNQSYSVSATYLNISSGLPLTPPISYCQINFNGTEINLTYNATSEAYADDFTFEHSGDYSLSVLCNTTAIGDYEVSASNYTSITIWDELLIQFVNQTQLGLTDYLIPNLNYTFGVNLTNLSGVQNSTVSPTAEIGASCSAEGIGAMSFNGSLYLLNTSENGSGTYSYNVSCDVGSNQLNLTAQNVTVDDYHTDFVDSGQSLGMTSGLANAVLLSPDHEMNSLISYTDVGSINIVNLTSGSSIYSESTSFYWVGVLGFYDAALDGDVDLFYSGNSHVREKVFENSEYSFSALFGLSIINDFGGAKSSVFDQNDDGKTDFMVSTTIEKPTIQLTNNGSGFDNQTLFEANKESTQCYFDANNDTAYDLYYAGDNGTTFAGIYHNNNGTFTLNQSLTGVVDGSCVFGFFTNDTTPDLLVYGTNQADEIEVLLYDNLNWSNPTNFKTNFTGWTKSTSILADFDNDGLSDFMVCGENNESVAQTRLYKNTGQNSFIEQNPFNASFQVKDCSLSATDYDRDGDLDLALAGVGGSNPIVLLNNTFNQFITNQPPTRPDNITINYNATTQKLYLNWSVASDNLTPSHQISYNIEVEDALKNLLISGKYPVSSHPVQGYLGNMQYRTSYTLKNVSPSNFIVRVQAIDNGYQHSAWREKSYNLTDCILPDNGTFSISAINCVLSESQAGNVSINITNNGSLTFTQPLNLSGNMSITLDNGTLNLQSINGSNNTINVTANGILFVTQQSELSNLSIHTQRNITLEDVTLTNVTLQTNQSTITQLRSVIFNITDEQNDSLQATISNGTTLNTSQLMLYEKVNDTGSFTPTHYINFTHEHYYLQNDSFTRFSGVRNITLSKTPLPDVSGFDLGTNFSELLTQNQSEDYANFSALENVTVGKSNVAQILFTQSLNVTELNLSQHITLKSNSVYVNSSAEERLNRSANITIFNVSYQKQPLIYKDDELCSDCENITHNGSQVSFLVSGFSNYTTSANANLNFFNQSRFIVNQSQSVFVSYLNISNRSQTVSDAACYLSSNNGDYVDVPMSLNTSVGYEINLNLTTQGEVNVSVVCNASSEFEPLNVTGSVSVYGQEVEYYLSENLTGVVDSGIGIHEDGSYFYTGHIPLVSLFSSSSDVTAYRYASHALADLNHDGIEERISLGLPTASADDATLSYTLIDSQIEGEIDKLYKGDLQVFDYDRDGDLDIFACGKSELDEVQTVIHENQYAQNKSLTFAQIAHNLTNVSDCSLQVADIDQDGWSDVILFGEGVGGSFEGAWFKNNQGVFTLNQSLAGFKEASGITWDFDQDGDDDVIVSGFNSSLISQTVVYENINAQLVENSTLSVQLIADRNAIITTAKPTNQTQLIISTESQIQSVIYNGNFQNTTLTNLITPASQGDAISHDINNNSQPQLILTGKTSADPIAHIYESTADLLNQQRTQPPTPNITATYTTQLNLNFTNASEVIYQVGHYNNLDAYISGARGSPLITTKTNISITIPKHCLVIQARAIDGALRSNWSEPITLNKRAEDKTNDLDEDCNGVAETSKTTIKTTQNSASFTNEVTQETTTDEKIIPPEPEVKPPTPKPDKPSEPLTQPKSKEFEQIYEITHFNDRTKITETIKNIERTPKSNIVLRKTFPKAILEAASTLNTPNDNLIIEEDPVLDFYIKDLNYLEQTTIVYTIPGIKTKEVLTQILSTFTANEQLSEQEIEAEEDKQAELAEELLDVTTQETQTENGTTYTINLDLKNKTQHAKRVEIEQEIPKCILEEVNEQILERIIDKDLIDNVEIKEADPIIVWNLERVDQFQQLQLKLDSFREEDCEDEFKIKVLAQDLINQNLKVNKLHLVLTYASIIFLMAILFWVLSFSENTKTYHQKPHIHRLVKLILKRKHKGESDQKIRENLTHNQESKHDIKEAFAHLTGNPHLHKSHKLREHAGEIIIFALLLTISILELSLGVTKEWDFLKKIISFVLMLYIFHRVNIVQMVFGQIHKKVALLLLSGMFLMHLKNLVIFAHENKEGAYSFLDNFYTHLINSAFVYDLLFFWSGLLIVLMASVYLAWKVNIRDGGLGHAIAKQPSAASIRGKLFRSGWVFALYMMFFITVFNRFMEWLAVAIDAVVYVLVTVFFLIHLFEMMHRKHRHHGFHKVMNIIMHQWVVLSALGVLALLFLREMIGFSSLWLTLPLVLLLISAVRSWMHHKGHRLQDAEQLTGLSDTFYLRCAKLFKHPVTLPLGLMLLLVMQVVVDTVIYLFAHITGHVSHLYQSHGTQTLFSLLSDSGLIAQHLADFVGVERVMMGVYYFVSIAGYFALFLMPVFVFALYYTHRKVHVSRLDLAKTAFHNHGWIKGLSVLFMTLGIPMIALSLHSKIFTIVPFIGEDKAGVDLVPAMISHSMPMVWWSLILTAIITVLMLLVVRHHNWRDRALKVVLAFGMIVVAVVYFAPYYQSVIDALLRQFNALQHAYSWNLFFANGIQFAFNLLDFVVVYVLGALVLITLFIPQQYRSKLIRGILLISPLKLRREFTGELHYLHYYQDALDHDSGNIVHHLQHFINHERKAGYSNEELREYILGHGYPKRMVKMS